MIAVLHFRSDGAFSAEVAGEAAAGVAADVAAEAAAEAAEFRKQGAAALEVLSARPGFIRGTLGRSTDDDGSWVLVTEWESVGAYRRGLGGYEVKLIATPFLSRALDQPSAFEQLVTASNSGIEQIRDSDRALDADSAPRDWAR